MFTDKKLERIVKKRLSRRPISDKCSYPWHIDLVPMSIEIDGNSYSHPIHESAVFVVHGIGQQNRTETAAHLRSGFEDSLPKIIKWQIKNNVKRIPDDLYLPPPFVREGYWANYSNIKETFPHDWEKFNEEDQDYYKNIWNIRILSVLRTFRWFFIRQLRLLNPTVIKDVGFLSWLMYWPLQITSFFGLILAIIRFPKIVTGFLADVRLYLQPKGVTERAIIERIDFRVRKGFMQMIGLDWNFKQLDEDKLIHASQKPRKFKRVIWVAHSLGSVISYNVLSDLFHEAIEIENTNPDDPAYDEEKLNGVRQFKESLFRFITLGSPLDKVAFLFKNRALRPWPKCARQDLLPNGEGKIKKEWWINFYHLMDPVSGSLESPLICGNQPPINEHIGLFGFKYLPGLAHLAYWKDMDTLRYILSRVYGKKILEDRIPKKKPAWVLGIIGFIFRVFQILLAILIIYGLFNWREIINKVKMLLGVLGFQ